MNNETNRGSGKLTAIEIEVRLVREFSYSNSITRSDLAYFFLKLHQEYAAREALLSSSVSKAEQYFRDTLLRIVSYNNSESAVSKMRWLAHIALLKFPSPEEQLNTTCRACGEKAGPDNKSGCDNSADPMCAWHVK